MNFNVVSKRVIGHLEMAKLLKNWSTILSVFSSAIYLLYAKLEEEHGLARHAMAVYDRATKAVLPEEQNEVKYLVKARDGRLRQSHQGSSARGTK